MFIPAEKPLSDPMSKIQNPSLPKEKIKVLLLEGISPTASAVFKDAGYSNGERLKTALDGDALKEKLKDVRILGIRSRTQLTKDVIDAAPSLMAVGCFSVGTNQIDLDAARNNGIPVFNAPFSNTRSVAELTIAEIVMLFRRTFPRSMAAHAGDWDKSAAGSREVRGKTLGIIGYGNIGSQLAVIAESMGLRVIYHDRTDKLRHGNVMPSRNLEDLLKQSDVVTLHVPETPDTKDMIGEKELRAMKKGAFLIPKEPSSNAEPFVSPLQGLDNVILTPHVGGSTEEAQERIGEEVARKLVEYSDVGSTEGSVNFPQAQLSPRQGGTRFIQVQRNLPGELQRLNEVFARNNVNIAAQTYQTDGEIGYVVLEAEGAVPDADAILAEIRDLSGTIRARLLNRVA